MAEFPNSYSFEPSDSDKKASNKKSDGKRAVDLKPPRVEIGATPVPKIESAFRPLGKDAMTSVGVFDRKPEVPKVDDAILHANEIHDRRTPEPQHAERHEPESQSAMPETVANLAARDVLAEQFVAQQLEAQRAAELDQEDLEKVDKDKKDKKEAAAKAAAQKEAAEPETEASRIASFDEFLAREMPAEFVDATSGPELTKQAAPELPAVASPAEMPAAERFEPSAEQPRFDYVEPGAAVPDLPQQHPELADFAAVTMPEAMAHAGAGNDGSHEGGGDPDYAAFHEAGPGEPPIDMGGGSANRPPNPPTAEGGDWDDEPQGFNTGVDPELAHNPWVPAGGLDDPATVHRMNAASVRPGLDVLSSRFNRDGFARTIGFLGLAVAVAEHFRVSKTRRMLKKQGKAQARELSKTNAALAQERLAHDRTRHRLDSLSAAHTETIERTREIERHRLPAAEVAAGAGLISAAAATELARRVEHKHATTVNQQELAHSLKHSRELGRAIKRNPELRDMAAPGEVAEATAAAAIAESNQQRTHELRELVGSSAYADAVRHERNFEHLQTQHSDNAGGPRQAGGADPHAVASFLSPQPTELELPAGQAVPKLPAHAGSVAPHRHANLVKPVAAATVLVALGIVLIMIFAA